MIKKNKEIFTHSFLYILLDFCLVFYYFGTALNGILKDKLQCFVVSTLENNWLYFIIVCCNSVYLIMCSRRLILCYFLYTQLFHLQIRTVLYFSFHSVYFSFLFFCLTVPVRTSSVMSNRSSDRGHSCLLAILTS